MEEKTIHIDTINGDFCLNKYVYIAGAPSVHDAEAQEICPQPCEAEEVEEVQPSDGGEKKPPGKPQSSFRQFVIDPDRCDEVLALLHRLIDGKPPKMCALTMLAAQKKGLLTQPTYKALHDEFPEIGDRKNYKYYLDRKDNYTDDIESIERSL